MLKTLLYAKQYKVNNMTIRNHPNDFHENEVIPIRKHLQKQVQVEYIYMRQMRTKSNESINFVLIVLEIILNSYPQWRHTTNKHI